MNKNLLCATALVMLGAGLAVDVYASASFSAQLGAACSACHESPLGTDSNVKPSAQSAFNSGGVIPGLQEFVANLPAVPGSNTKPVINLIDTQYNVEVGDPLSIVLEVADAEDDPVDVTVKPNPAGATVAAGDLSDNQLPTFNFDWTPVAGQENKVYKVKFTAKENDTKKKYSSKPVGTSIRVWPAGNRDQTSIKKLVLSSAKWKDGKLSLKGVIQFNKLLTKDEKATYMTAAPAKTFALTQGVDGNGTDILISPTMTTKPTGSWAIDGIDLPASPAFNCSVTMDFEGSKAARKIAGAPKDCIK